MDTDVIKDGTNIKGKYSKARSKDEVLKNTSGVIDFLKSTDSTFCMLQEVDTK